MTFIFFAYELRISVSTRITRVFGCSCSICSIHFSDSIIFYREKTDDSLPVHCLHHFAKYSTIAKELSEIKIDFQKTYLKYFTSCFKLIEKFLSRIDKNRHILFYASTFSSGVTFFSKVEILFRGNESFLLQAAYVRLTKASLFALLDTIVFHSNLTPLDLCLRY